MSLPPSSRRRCKIEDEEEDECDDEDDASMTEILRVRVQGGREWTPSRFSRNAQRCRLDAVTCKERVRRLCQHSRTHREHAITYQLRAISDAVLRRSVRLKFLRLSPVVAGKMLHVMAGHDMSWRSRRGRRRRKHWWRAISF